IQADGWMVIHCLWVVGKHKNKGYGNELLQLAIKDAKEQGIHGVVGMSADKGGWLPNTKIYLNNGFEKVDEMEPYFSLYAKKFSNNSPKPKFHPLSDDKIQKYSKGVTIIYTDQCPYIVDLVEELDEIFKNNKDVFNVKKLNNCEDAQQNGVFPYGTYCICLDGEISLYKHATKREILEHLNP
ncbi:MAG: GNAT family N-acetyltransferase, partial [Promethearchaeota archaeon]